MTIQQLAEALGEDLPPMTRAELWWCAWLWLSWAHIEQLRAEWRRDLYRRLEAKYATHRRLDELCLRESPVLRHIRESQEACARAD